MIAITVAGKTKYTSAKNDVTKASTVYWGEHLFFDRNNVVRLISMKLCEYRLKQILRQHKFRLEC